MPSHASTPTFLAIHPPRRLWPSAPAPRYLSPLSSLPPREPAVQSH